MLGRCPSRLQLLIRPGRPGWIAAAGSHAALPPALPVPEALGIPVAGRHRLANRGIDIARPVRTAAWWSGISARIRIAAGSVIIARIRWRACQNGQSRGGGEADIVFLMVNLAISQTTIYGAICSDSSAKGCAGECFKLERSCEVAKVRLHEVKETG